MLDVEKALIATVVGLLCAGCTEASRQKPLDHGWAPAGACVFVGNRADQPYCATTGTQILANPSTYDGHLVRVSGWVVSSPDGTSAILFLTKDARETAAHQGSVNLYGTATSTIARFALRSNSAFSEIPVQVQGRFRLYGLESGGMRSKQGPNALFRFGAIEEIDKWR